MDPVDLLDKWDETENAIQRVCTSLPAQLSEAVERLDGARREMRAFLQAQAVAAQRAKAPGLHELKPEQVHRLRAYAQRCHEIAEEDGQGPIAGLSLGLMATCNHILGDDKGEPQGKLTGGREISVLEAANFVAARGQRRFDPAKATTSPEPSRRKRRR